MRCRAIFLTVAVALTAVANTQAPGRFNTVATTSPPQVVAVDHALPLTSRAEHQVIFNVKTLKYHCPTCSAAKRCTKMKRGGVACKICGGACRKP